MYWVCSAEAFEAFVLSSLFSFWAESATQLITEVSHPEFSSYYQKKETMIFNGLFLSYQ